MPRATPSPLPSTAASPPAVAVVTRTRNRPVTLERAADSVLAQTFSDWVWVVVNDGGDPDPVEAIARRVQTAGRAVVVVHRVDDHGVAAAANAGVAAAQSEFVALHDDDDAWHPRFLEHTVAALRTPVGARCLAAVTWTRYRYERITPAGIELLAELDAPDAPEGVALVDVLGGGFYPIPISVVYRRRVHELVGAYRPELPVFEDWDLYLRLLQHGDMTVVPERLAYYSIRPDATGAYGNSIASRITRGVTAARMRNEWLRADLAEGRLGFGTLAMVAPTLVAANRVAKKVIGLAGVVHRARRAIATRSPR